MKDKPCSQCSEALHCGSMKFISCKNNNWKFYAPVIRIKSSATTPNSEYKQCQDDDEESIWDDDSWVDDPELGCKG